MFSVKAPSRSEWGLQSLFADSVRMGSWLLMSIMVEKKGAVCDAVMKDVCGSLRCLRLLALERSEQVCFWVKACDLASHHIIGTLEKGSREGVFEESWRKVSVAALRSFRGSLVILRDASGHF